MTMSMQSDSKAARRQRMTATQRLIETHSDPHPSKPEGIEREPAKSKVRHMVRPKEVTVRVATA